MPRKKVTKIPPKPLELRLETLGSGVTALYQPYEASFGSAAGHCLEDQGHCAPAELVVSGLRDERLPLYWQSQTEEEARTWENDQQTTEFGACGVALVLMAAIDGSKAVQVARKPSGFDFWMSPRDSVSPFQKSTRLEVSGIRSGPSDKKSREQQKATRLKQYPNALPALIVVVEFSEPGALVGKP